MADFVLVPPPPQEEERLRLEAQRSSLELPGLQSHEVPWSQERALLTQEVRLFRRNTIIFYMKLRSILMHWRLGRKDNPPEETGHPEVSAGRVWTLGRNTAVDHFAVLAACYDCYFYSARLYSVFKVFHQVPGTILVPIRPGFQAS